MPGTGFTTRHFASQAEVDAGTVKDRAVVPSTLVKTPPVVQRQPVLANFSDISARYSIPGWSYTDNDTQGMGSGSIFLIPIYVAVTRTYTGIVINVTTQGAAGKLARLGIYNASFVSGALSAGSLLLDAGTVSIASTGDKEITISQELEAGEWYFLAMVNDDTAGNVRFQGADRDKCVWGPVSGYRDSINAMAFPCLEATSQTTGALPDPAPTPDAITGINRIGLVKLKDI